MASDMIVDECHGCQHYKRIDQIISRASRQAAKQSGDYTANLERALTELGCKVTRLESIS